MSTRWLRILVGVGLVVALSRSSEAHDPFEITTSGMVGEQSLALTVTMTRRSALILLGQSAPRAELQGPPPPQLAHELRKAASRLYEVSSHGAPLALHATNVRFTEEDEVEFQLTFARPEPGTLRLVATHLRTLPEGYTSALTLSQEAPRSHLTPQPQARDPHSTLPLGRKFLHSADSAFDAVVVGSGSVPSAQVTEPWSRRFRSFLVLGVQHVVTGYDHLLFLAGLLVACRRVRAMLGLVTCFTVAHSLSLGLSTLAELSLPARLVEPLIAASLVFVGVENLLARDQPKRRYPLTFAFGLVHGLGFASVLANIGLGSSVALPLFSFNLGVELAQLGIAALVFPPLILLRGRSFGPLGVRIVSMLVAMAGGYWVIERTLLA